MIKIRPYEFTDRYLFEKMVKTYYTTFKLEAPDSQKIVNTIGFYSSYPQCGKIYIILYKNNPVGYCIVSNIWQQQFGKINYLINELFIDKDYQKHKLEINMIEYLLKQDDVHSIEIKMDRIKSISRRIFRFLKFERNPNPNFVKVI